MSGEATRTTKYWTNIIIFVPPHCLIQCPVCFQFVRIGIFFPFMSNFFYGKKNGTTWRRCEKYKKRNQLYTHLDFYPSATRGSIESVEEIPWIVCVWKCLQAKQQHCSFYSKFHPLKFSSSAAALAFFCISRIVWCSYIWSWIRRKNYFHFQTMYEVAIFNWAFNSSNGDGMMCWRIQIHKQE